MDNDIIPGPRLAFRDSFRKASQFRRVAASCVVVMILDDVLLSALFVFLSTMSRVP